MKAAIVLQADSPSFQRHAGEIDALLSDIAMTSMFDEVELWLFYPVPQFNFNVTAIKQIPKFNCNVMAIKKIPLKNIYLPESILHALVHLASQDTVDLFFFSSDGLGEELATRLGFRLRGSSALQVETCKLSAALHLTPEVDSEKMTGVEVTKPIYGNNLTARFLLTAPPYCISPAKLPGSQIQMVPFEGGMDASTALELTHLELNFNENRSAYGDGHRDKEPAYHWVTDWVVIPHEPDTGLSSADLILVVGQGAKDKKTVDQLHRIADTLGAELGASRPVVMNAWTDMNRLVGASGLILSPKCCIAAGVSGTAVFSVGIKNSDFIVAINTDSSAAIFQLADVGIVGDLKAVLTELEQVVLADKPNVLEEFGNQGGVVKTSMAGKKRKRDEK